MFDDRQWNSAGVRGGRREEASLFENARLHFFPAERVDQPLHTRTEFVVAVSGLIKDAQDRFHRGQQQLTRRKGLQRQRWMRIGTQTASDKNSETCFDLTVVADSFGGDHADIVEHRLAAVGGAAGEVDLELAGHALRDWIAEEVLERRFSPLGDVEDLVRAGSCEVARLYVAHGVATRFACRHPNRTQEAHDFWDLVELGIVELDVLPGRDVSPAARVFLHEIGQHVELFGCHRPVRDLDPHHLVGFPLPLAVDAVGEAEHPKDVFVDLACQVAVQHLFETLYVVFDRRIGYGGNRSSLARGWCRSEIGDGHEDSRGP